jgi:hypothetical protein
MLDGQLDESIASVVEDPLDARQLALGAASKGLGDLEVLAPDDRPHGTSPRPLERGRRPDGDAEAPPRRACSTSIEYRPAVDPTG